MEEKIYGGTFIVQDKEYNGQIRFVKEKYLILELDVNEPIIDQNELNFKNITIFGSTVTGAEVTLYNCSCTNRHSFISYGKTVVTFNCQYLIWGRHIDNNIKTLYVELENAVEWSGLRGLSQKNFEEGCFDIIKFKEKENQKIIYKDFNISFYTIYRDGLSARPMPEKAEISERLMIKIESNHNQPINKFVDITSDFINIISFSIENNVNILSLKCEDENFYQVLTNGDKKFFKMEFIGLFKTKPIYKQSIHNNIVSLDMINGKILEKCFDKYEDLKHIIEIYVLLLNNPELPIHIQFTNIVQALESFHARFVCDKYKKYLKSINDRYLNSPHYNFYYNYLLPEQQDGITDYIVLTSRINDCFCRVSFEVFDYFKDGIISTKITDTRHYFTHYNKNKYKNSLKGKSLEASVALMIFILNYLIWQFLGLDRKHYLINNLSYIDFEKLKEDA